MWSNLEYINCCVWCYGDDETAIFYFFWTFLVFHILYIRWELIKRKKEKKVEIIHSHPPFPKIDLIMDHTMKIFGQPCPYEKKKIRVNGLWLLVMIPIHVQCAICIQSLCVWVCDPYMCPTGLSLMYKRLYNDLLVHPGFIYYNLLQ